ncbi:uncharacterized protein LOC130799476 isoform X2 [Amaranthus tricolor]|uniref:uncharacterized protein LOC130799476 isoform X2 n=1 Tax=Amaranthus tricolor TaxID=29722 RepID=UPI00258B8A9E|nr:uncharacterized protein LOC130799476 isoform X2 [Amaranthus tricolor]XP_057518566.1 uncharacterized protein LOC130799476 isoform X2 [Amaranthus tricolor]
MDAVELVIPIDVTKSKLMGSDVLIGARVCSSDGDVRDSDSVSNKIDECTSLLAHRGANSSSGSSSWLKKTDTEICRTNCLPSRLGTEDVSMGVIDGVTRGSTILMSEYEGKLLQRKMGKVPRNVSGSFKKPRVQADNLFSQAEIEDAKTETEKLGLHLIKCSTADKSQAGKQKSVMNGRRADRRNHKVPMKTKFDPFSLKVGVSNFSPANGGGNIFGMYGLKPDIHDISKLMDDISLDELLEGTYKWSDSGNDKGKKVANVTENILDSVKKACSVIRLRVMKQAKQAEEVDIQVNEKIHSSSPSNRCIANDSDGDEMSHIAGLSKSCQDTESSIKVESPDEKDIPLYQPRDILERLALPPPKDLESLLQDALKPAVSSKLSDTRNGKTISHRVSLPPFPWSHNFNGHYKSNNDAIRMANRSTCQGRWVRIRSNASFIGGGSEDFVDLESLTYDNSLVPAGQLIYKLPEIESSNQQCYQQSSSGVIPTSNPPASLPSTAHHSPRVLAAAQTLCDIASDSSNRLSNGIPKWPKQPSQKSMKARNSRSSEKSEELLTPKSETLLDHVVRCVDYGSSSKRPKIPMVERREDFSHIHAVIGLSSVSAPRSNRSSPSRLSRESVTEARNLNGGFIKAPFMAPPPPRVLDRSNNHNPPKLRKVSPMDWNRSRS